VSASRSLFARLIVALLVFALAIWMSFVVAIVDSGRRDEAQHADAIVVLGAAQYEGKPSPVLKARLDHAAELWARGLAPRMIVTGGRGDREHRGRPDLRVGVCVDIVHEEIDQPAPCLQHRQKADDLGVCLVCASRNRHRSGRLSASTSVIP